MNLFRLRRTIRRTSEKIDNNLQNIGWTWSKAAITGVLIVVIITLSLDIYFSVKDAVKNYKLLAQEEQKLQEVLAESKELDEELDYYGSLEYKQRYAYDSLNLARENESIYLIETGGDIEYGAEKKNPDPIKRENKRFWWELLFGEAI
jgi:hypothetical protein